MWDKAVILAVRREKDRDFEMETLGIRMRGPGLADTKQLTKCGI